MANENIAKSASLQIDGVENASVQTVFLDDLPIHKAAFACTGSKVQPNPKFSSFSQILMYGALHLAKAEWPISSEQWFVSCTVLRHVFEIMLVYSQAGFLFI